MMSGTTRMFAMLRVKDKKLLIAKVRIKVKAMGTNTRHAVKTFRKYSTKQMMTPTSVRKMAS